MKLKLPLTTQNFRKQFPKLIVFLITFILFFSLPLLADDKPEQGRKARKADKLFAYGDYNDALPMYLSLVEKYPTNVFFNFRAGVCYNYSNIETLKSIEYLETARKNITTPADSIPDLFYYLGHVYQMTNRFEEAINNYATFKRLFKGGDNLSNIDEEIEQCESGIVLKKKPKRVTITNLSDNVNSIYPDYAPALPADESKIVFTSKRRECTGRKRTPDGGYYEDIFFSDNVSNNWSSSQKLDTSFVKPSFWAALFTPSKSIGSNINTNEHDASIALSPDGKTLYMYRFNDIWVSPFVDGKWAKPAKLSTDVDGERSHESSVCLAADGNTLYFVSDRPGGLGGKDLYKAPKLEDGTWGNAENLGAAINTELDEEAPFLDADNKTFYFSSQSHNSIGGFDIFKSTLENNKWTEPVSLGYPINSGADDIFYIYNPLQNNAFFASIRKGGIGNLDIYKINFNKPSRVLLATTFSENLIPAPVQITVVDSAAQSQLTLTPNEATEINYNTSEKYKINVLGYKNSITHTVEFEMPETDLDMTYYQELNYSDVKNEKGQTIAYKTTLYNAFFDIENQLPKKKTFSESTPADYAAYIKTINSDHPNFKEYSFIDYLDTAALAHADFVFKTILFDFSKSELKSETLTELDNIIKYLKENEAIKMEIVGYTDSKGSVGHNNNLSRKRALAIMDYFIVEGVAANRLKYKGLGESNPVAPNENADGTDNPEGRRLNRRVEFVILQQ